MPQRLPHDWFPAPLPSNIRLGEDSWLYSSYAFLHYRSRRRPGVVIGSHSGVYNGSFFDLGPRGRVRIGDYTAIVGGIFCTDADIEIGSYSFVAHEVVLADHAAAAPLERNGRHRARSENIRIGDNVWIGARAIILGGAVIGDDAVIGAGTLVAGEVPAGAVVAGNPARLVSRAR